MVTMSKVKTLDQEELPTWTGRSRSRVPLAVQLEPRYQININEADGSSHKRLSSIDCVQRLVKFPSFARRALFTAWLAPPLALWHAAETGDEAAVDCLLKMKAEMNEVKNRARTMIGRLHVTAACLLRAHASSHFCV